MNPFIKAFDEGIVRSKIARHKISVVSDIPIAPDDIKGLGVDFFHTLRGRAIAFSTGLKLANPSLKVIPFVGDLMTLGGNHFVHASRRNMELAVICINNFVYKKINGKTINHAETGQKVSRPFSPYSTFEEPFNIPHLGNSCGAVYTARWTALHSDGLTDSIAECLNKKGLSVIEVILPGPDFYNDIENNNIGLLNQYYRNSKIINGEDPRNVGITADREIIVGKFTDNNRPTFLESYNSQMSKILGDKFIQTGA